MCRMIGKKLTSTSCISSDSATPDKTHKGETLFRLRVGYFGGKPVLRGSYPFCENYFSECKLADKVRKTGKFECPKIQGAEPKNFFWWSGSQRKYYCEGCSNQYQKLYVDYRKGSFMVYEHPMYETAIGFGH